MKIFNVKKIIIIGLIIGLLPMDIFCFNLAAKAEEASKVIDPESVEGEIVENIYTTAQKLHRFTSDMLLLTESKEPRLSIDAYDYSELKKYSVLYEAITNDPEYLAEYEKNRKIPEKLKEEFDITIDPSDFAIRILESLINLVMPEDMGGAGREWIKVGSITRGYSSRATRSPLKDMDEKQLEEYPIDQAKNLISPHYKEVGQAADVTEVDYLRGTKFVYEDDKLVEKTKLDKVPIKVAWQTDKASGKIQDVPREFGENLDKLTNNMLSQTLNLTLNEWLSEQGIDLENLGNLGTNLANIVFNLGSNWYKENWELPTNSQLGSDLGGMGKNMGQAIFAEMTEGIIPATGLEGNSLEEVYINSGREILAQKLGLPEYAFREGGDNSKQLLVYLGQRVMEDNLGLSVGSLKDLDKGNNEQLKEKIGQGFIEKQLNLQPGDFSGRTTEEIKKTIGSAKFQEIVDNANLIDGLLYLDSGTISQLINDPQGFKKKVGERVVERRILIYEKGPDGSERRDEVFNITNPENKDLMDRFLAADKDVFEDIGIDALTKVLTLNNEDRKIIRKWLKTGEIETDPDKDELPKISEEALAKEIGLKANDLWRIFVHSQASQVFQRVGQVAWISVLVPSLDKNANSQVDSFPDKEFYHSRYKIIKEQASELNQKSKNQEVKNLAQEIYNLALEMETYENDLKDDALKAMARTIFYPLEEKSKENIAYILGKLTLIEKLEKNKQTEVIKKNSNEIIEGVELLDLSKISENDITELRRARYLEPTYKNDLVKVLNGRKTLNDFIREIGLVYWGTVAGLDQPNDLINVWQKIQNNPSQDPIKIFQSVIDTNELKNIRDEINVGFGLAPWGSSSDYYKVTVNDVMKLILGQITPFISKLGTYAMDQALYFSPGYGSKEITTGQIDLDTASKHSGVNRFTRHVLGLIEKAPTDGNMADNITKLYLSENLGLPKNFTFDFNNFIKEDRNRVRILRAFGVTIPEELGSDWQKIIDWANSTQPWNEKENSIKAQIGYLKLPIDEVKKFLADITSGNFAAATTSFNVFTKSVKDIVADYITIDKINEGIGLDESREKGLDFLQFLPAQIKQLKEAFEKGDGGKLLALFALAATNKIMTDSNFAHDSGLMGNPQNASDLAGISIMLQMIANGNDKKAVEEGFALFALHTIGSHYPQALDAVGKGIVIYQTIETFVRALDEAGRKSRGEEMAGNMAQGLTIDMPGAIITPNELEPDLNVFFANGDVADAAGDIAYATAMMVAAKKLHDYKETASEAGISILPEKGDGNSIDDFGGQPPTYKGSKIGILGPTEDEKYKAYLKTIEGSKIAYEVVQDTDVRWREWRKWQKEQYYKKLEEEKQKQYLENILFAQMDVLSMQMGGPPISWVMFRGTDDQKKEALRQYAIYYLLQGKGIPAWGVAAADILTRALVHGQKVDAKQLGAAFDIALADLLDLSYIPPGLGEGFSTWVLEGDDTRLMQSLKDGAILYGSTFLDKTLGMPTGTIYTMYNMWNTYQQALAVYHEAVGNAISALNRLEWFTSYGAGEKSVSELLELQKHFDATLEAKEAAFKKLQMTSAAILSTAVNMILGKTFAKLDQQLGLPSGTISLLVSAVIYSTIGGLGFSAIAGMLWPAAALILLGGLFGGGLFGGKNKKQKTTKVEVIYTACRYWPGFDSGPPADIEPECPNEFHAETQEKFIKGAIAAANHVIKNRLLYDLLTLGKRTDDTEMLPNRIETYNPEHVQYHSQLADEVYCGGETGCMEEYIKQGSKRGIGWNKQLWNRVLYNY